MAELFQVLTANRLSDGAVVYGAGGAWVERLDEAELLTSKALVEARLAAAKADVAKNLIVLDGEDHNKIMQVVREDGRIRPLRAREKIRASGPSVRRDLGKQAEQDSGVGSQESGMPGRVPRASAPFLTPGS
jgi:hypothetical protein